MTLLFNILLALIAIVYSGVELWKLLKKTATLHYKLFFSAVAVGHFITTFLIVYYIDALTLNDSHAFYDRALESSNWFDSFGLGHRFMSFIIYPFVQLGIRIEVLFIVFSAISCKGFFIFFELLKIHSLKKVRHLFLLGFFLIPSVHFWTGMLTKEALLLLLFALLLKEIQQQQLKYQVGLLVLGIFLIRPHAGIVLLGSLVLNVLIDAQYSKRFKKNLVIGFIGSVLILIPVFFSYFLKIKGLSSSAFIDRYQQFIAYTVDRGTTSINLADTTIFSRLGYLLFMPLPFLYPLKNTFITIISIENSYYLLVVGYLIWNFKTFRKQLCSAHATTRFALITSLCMMLLFASYLYNLGLGNRMRLMFYPYLFYGLIRVMK